MNIEDVSTQLLFTTVPLWAEKDDGKVESATAFIFDFRADPKSDRSIPFLVSCFHAVSGARRAVIELTEAQGDKPQLGERLRVEITGDLLLQYVDPKIDLVAIPIGALLNQLRTQGRAPFFRSISADVIPSPEVIAELAALEDVVFIGYPAGLRDEKNLVPLIRRGITATPVWNDFGGEQAFMIDANVFPGSSGSPVFILNQGAYATKSGLAIGNRLLFLGLISQTMVRSGDQGSVYLGLGKVINSSAAGSFIGRIAQLLQSKLTDSARPS